MTLGLMAKYWTAGQVKTRLGASIGMAAAAALHRLFVVHLGESLANSADRRIILVTPGERQPEFASCLPTPWETAVQGEGDLGQRMSRWFRRSLTSESNRALLIGADCPTLGPAEIERATASLARHDLVLGPAADGGYYLIGLRGPWDDRLGSLFEFIPWSSDQVYRATCERAARAGLSIQNLDVFEDIDTIDELDRLRSRLAETARDDPRDAELARAIDQIVTDHRDSSSQQPLPETDPSPPTQVPPK